MPEQRLGPLLRVLAALTAPTFFPAEKIDHSVLPIANRQPEATAAYGTYLTTNCKAWHRDNLQGGPPLAPQAFRPYPILQPGAG